MDERSEDVPTGATARSPGGDGVRGRSPRSSMETPEVRWRIDCDECVMVGTDACDDCVVTFLCTRDEGGAAVIDVAEARALRLLHQGGLVPELRHRRRTG